jgi:hypothetical protein
MLWAGGAGDSSLKSSRTARFAWFLMKARPSAQSPELDLTASALANWVKHARAERTQRQERADEGRARGVSAAAPRGPRVADGTPGANKSRGLLRERAPLKFAWIEAEKAHYPVHTRCRWLGVTPSGFYAWRSRPESVRVREDRRLKALVHTSFKEGRGYNGSPRVQDDLVEWGERVSRKRTIRPMREDGLKARGRKRYKVTTDTDHDQPIAANRLQQAFTAERPNQRWAGDTTQLVIGESGKLYLAVILDLFSRFVVG